MCESERAGSRPRRRSRALALIARACAAVGLAVGARGTARSAQASDARQRRASRRRTGRPSRRRIGPELGVAVVAVAAPGGGRASARRRRCSGWTAPGRQRAGGAGGPWSGRWRPTRRPGGRRRAGPPSHRRSPRRSARRARGAIALGAVASVAGRAGRSSANSSRKAAAASPGSASSARTAPP